MPGDKYASIKRPRVYRALRRRGYSKEQAARIANSSPKKKAMAAKAMAPGRKRIWQRAYHAAKAAGASPADARAKARLALRERDTASAWRGYERAIARMAKSASQFAVYKDASGQLRWLARTTTAFEDRDREILAVAALDADSQRMTRTRQFGPLRYWHAGLPDLGTPAEPWGPGLDIGMCDYSVVIGRTRYESGTFASPALAEAFKAAAGAFELSPGFYHPYGPAGPADGVYRDMATFERSVVPTRHARAANRFTGLVVKEYAMNEQELARRVKAFLADMQRMGVPTDAGMDLLRQGQTAEKSADDRGIAYKSSPAEAVYTAPDGTPGLIRDGQWMALKAMPMPGAIAPAAVAEAVPAAEGKMTPGEALDTAVEEAATEEDDADRLLSDAEIDLLAGAVVRKLMAELGGIQAAVAQMEETAKQYGFARKEQDAIRAQLTQLGQQFGVLTAALKSFADDLPAGHRASQDAATVVQPDDPIATVAAKNAGAKQEQGPRSIIDQIAATLPAGIGSSPGYAWPFSAPPPAGVNAQQHAAPSAPAHQQ